MSREPKALKLHRGGRERPRHDPDSARRDGLLRFVVTDILADLQRYATSDDELIKAANAATGPKVTTPAAALERVRGTLLATRDSESFGVALRSTLKPLTLRHSLRPWVRGVLETSPRDRTGALESLVGWYSAIAQMIATRDGVGGWTK